MHHPYQTMTQKYLIDTCNLYDGQCGYCRPGKVKKFCNKYKEQYKTSPFLDDEYNPERYNETEIVISDEGITDKFYSEEVISQWEK